MINYIGDLSKADAFLLKCMAEDADNIMEFGVGASTQILSYYSRSQKPIICIETDMSWVRATQNNFKILGIENIPRFYTYGVSLIGLCADLDFVFDDGVDHLRTSFAQAVWPHIKVGGYLAFHDTRRAVDFKNVLQILEQFASQIDLVQFNANHSNITLVRKKEAEPYDNWQISENKTRWQLGWEPIPEHIKPTLKIPK